MTRMRIFIMSACLLFVLGAAPIALAQEEPANEPAVVLEADGGAIEEEAWTFRYLVPTLMVLTGISVVFVGIGYGLRVRGKYRVAR